MSSYNVVFQYTHEVECHSGVRTWRSFLSKEDFDQFYTDEIKKYQSIVEEGVTTKRCVELCQQTSEECLLAAAYSDAEDSDGHIDPDKLREKLIDVAYAKPISQVVVT